MHRGLRLAQGDVHGSDPVDRLEDDLELADAVVERAELIGDRAFAVELERVAFRGCTLSGSEIEAGRLTDVRFEGCDLSGFVLLECSLVRVALEDCRVSGVALSRGSAKGLELRSCRGEGLALFSAEVHDLVVEDCELDQPDFRETRVVGGRIERSRLTGADFGGARVNNLHVADSVFERLGGGGGLSGATVDVPTLMSMAPGLAAALGITVVAT